MTIRIQHEGNAARHQSVRGLHLSSARKRSACSYPRPRYCRSDRRAHPQACACWTITVGIGEKCNNVLFEKTVRIDVIERDMPPVFEAYYGNPDNQTCKKCGHVNPGRPARK